MSEFGIKDCIHFDEELESACKIKKGCGRGGILCTPAWTSAPCASRQSPSDTELINYGEQIYAYKNTLVLRQEKDGKCWQLRGGDYLGELEEKDLIFVKRAVLSD